MRGAERRTAITTHDWLWFRLSLKKICQELADLFRPSHSEILSLNLPISESLDRNPGVVYNHFFRSDIRRPVKFSSKNSFRIAVALSALSFVRSVTTR